MPLVVDTREKLRPRTREEKWRACFPAGYPISPELFLSDYVIVFSTFLPTASLSRLSFVFVSFRRDLDRLASGGSDTSRMRLSVN